jgi:uncharacterized protein
MVTIAAINNMFAGIYQDLQSHGITPRKMILFGSYAKGHPKKYSDVDIAILADEFIGARMLDYEKIKHLHRKYMPAEFHTFKGNASVDDNPFLEEIFNTGKEWTPDQPLVWK